MAGTDDRRRQLDALGLALASGAPGSGPQGMWSPGVENFPKPVDPGGVPYPFSPRSWVGREYDALYAGFGKQGDSANHPPVPALGFLPGGPGAAATLPNYNNPRPLRKRSISRGQQSAKAIKRSYGDDIAAGA